MSELTAMGTRFGKEKGRNWLTNRVVSEWKRLTEDAVAAEITDSFKRRLHKYEYG